MAAAAVTLASLATGCNPAYRIYHRDVDPERVHAAVAILEDAAACPGSLAVLGRGPGWVWARPWARRGTPRITIRGHARRRWLGVVSGFPLRSGPHAVAARGRVWVVGWAAPELIAHELGHVLGLDHHPDPENLMYRVASKPNLDASQIEKLRRRLGCEGGGKAREVRGVR